MKNRKQLPNFGYLNNLYFDVSKIKKHLIDNNLIDPNKYVDIKVSANSAHKNFVLANEFSKNSFFIEDGASPLEGESYVQLYLTDFDTSKSSGMSNHTSNTSIYSRTKRLDPNSPNYLPEADELNYGIRNKHANGILADILDSFSSKITRVRLAYLRSGHSIKPHIDYDPSYIVRYHLPIITNTKCGIHVVRGGNTYDNHFPADGRVYFLNAGHLHWASNNSNIDRLHLIIDVHGQSELENLTEL